MELKEALKALGADRVIWIDDKFNQSPTQLAELLLASPEIARQCGTPTIVDILDKAAFLPDPKSELQQVLNDMREADRAKLVQCFFEKEVVKTGMTTPELEDAVVDTVCKLLSIALEDRWTFKDAVKNLKAVCDSNDEKVSYIIDLNESGGSDKRGLEILQTLHQHNSKGTVFLLTHSATTTEEASKEFELQNDLDGRPAHKQIPICVISKARLTEAADEPAMSSALRIAIKRAGLRRSVHEVLNHIKPNVSSAVDEAAQQLLAIPPEQLDEYVVERGFQEGLSELHVVERAITAVVSQKVREIFAQNPDVLQSTARLRSLRSVELAESALTPVHQNLDGFRRLEVWESDELINKSFTPLACGDIFQIDEHEKPNDRPKLFLLLGQPCDISLRGEKDRDQEHAMLVPLKQRDGQVDGDKLKLKMLQFKIDNVQLACDFRNATAVRLSILDLASLREDGRVRYDVDQPTGLPLLAALQSVIEKRIKIVKQLLEGNENAKSTLQLCFRSSSPFSVIHEGKLSQQETKTINGNAVTLPKRVTWSLRRTGRVRMPYASALLRDYLAIQGRDAFDLDFTKEAAQATPSCAPAAVSCG
ncbi:hypothetical protein AZ34_14545 [Hylemonella gracilis str. Niagara R]|uniref:Response receiver domain-containing protein n=1 Tax=Hylemonella gracilis str. Niagara R TaxID=1458275 RepID=A0A016XP06_9BURK|nr:hypothetical protein [Hylemonella gracilis]EYC52948.1 hypothetical protein AZ34_14545 [Hylemonella gracilis str. Niagara R]